MSISMRIYIYILYVYTINNFNIQIIFCNFLSYRNFVYDKKIDSSYQISNISRVDQKINFVSTFISSNCI